MRHWKKGLLGLALLIPLVAWATLPKVWSNGEVLRATDLNANFQHVESALRGGTHTAITNADISAAAGIATTKLAAATSVPRMWVRVGSTSAQCTASPCTITAGSGGVTSVTRLATGNYRVNFAARIDAFYAVLVTVIDWVAGTVVMCNIGAFTTTYAAVDCRDQAGTYRDVSFSAVIFDDN